jgi:hypothetical protein
MVYIKKEKNEMEDIYILYIYFTPPTFERREKRKKSRSQEVKGQKEFQVPGFCGDDEYSRAGNSVGPLLTVSMS